MRAHTHVRKLSEPRHHRRICTRIFIDGDVDFLPAEINNFRQMLKRRKESESANWQGPETLLELQGYVHRLQDAFTEMDKLVTIACSLLCPFLQLLANEVLAL